MSEKTSAEFEIKVPKDWTVNEEVMADGSRVFKIKPNTTTVDYWRKFFFKKVPVSELRLDDAFMKYQPNTDREQNFKSLVETAIKNRLNDFWRPVYDPSFDDKGRICYEPGNRPAVGESYSWWEKSAKKYAPERGSRLGTKSEYIAFFAVLIKDLVASGKSVEWAWNAVCNDSKELGHYWNSKDAKNAFETTGNREVCGWYDLANCYKILAEDEEADGFWLAGGNYGEFSNNTPLAFSYHFYNRYGDCASSCGWLVLESCPK